MVLLAAAFGAPGAHGVLHADLEVCRRCPRLVDWRERVARERRAAFATETYWGRPVPGFGDLDAAILLYGLAPAAHGANRTGTHVHRGPFGRFPVRVAVARWPANQPISRSRDDGLRLKWASGLVSSPAFKFIRKILPPVDS